MLTEAEVLAALRDCYDPEIRCNVVDLGLIRSVAIERDLDAPGTGIAGVPQKHIVTISLILTNPGETAEAQTRAQIVNRLAGLESVGRTTVTILDAPRWTPNFIMPNGRRILGLDGNPGLIQIL
jgi:metal-sulfur cluster biosynthetic enzyme